MELIPMDIESLEIVWNSEPGPSGHIEKLEDRLLLFSLIYAIKPKRCLEIGAFKGGSARIIVKALDACGTGNLISIDPEPLMAEATLSEIKHRHHLIIGTSPKCIREASALVPGERFDFVYIDGDHDRAYADIEGLLPFLSPNAFILLHDCHYHRVKQDIDNALQDFPQLSDCGIISTRFVEIAGHKWIGCRMLRHTDTAQTKFARLRFSLRGLRLRKASRRLSKHKRLHEDS